MDTTGQDEFVKLDDDVVVRTPTHHVGKVGKVIGVSQASDVGHTVTRCVVRLYDGTELYCSAKIGRDVLLVSRKNMTQTGFLSWCRWVVSVQDETAERSENMNEDITRFDAELGRLDREVLDACKRRAAYICSRLEDKL